VNRLQRELSQLRAQTASVVSNASSSSSSHPAVFDDTAAPAELPTPGTIYPTSARRRRASSSVSSRSLTSHTAGPGERTSQASVDRARDAGMTTPAGSSRSRQNSHSTTLPAPVMARSVNSPAPPRASLSRQSSERGLPPPMHAQASPYFGGSLGQIAQSSGARQDEAAQAKAALEVARKENDRLVSRVRELEAALKEKQKSKNAV